MRKILPLDLFENDEKKPIVTFDFDGVLHVGEYFFPHGTDLQKGGGGNPNVWGVSDEMVDLLNKTAKSFTCVIVSGRPAKIQNFYVSLQIYIASRCLTFSAWTNQRRRRR